MASFVGHLSRIALIRPLDGAIFGEYYTGFMKGRSAIHIARVYLGQRKNYNGMHFWARGYYVSTVGADEEVIRNYIRNQEKEDQKLEALTGM